MSSIQWPSKVLPLRERQGEQDRINTDPSMMPKTPLEEFRNNLGIVQTGLRNTDYHESKE